MSRLLTIPQISRSAISFAVVVAAYGAYSLLAVPLIEPVAAEREKKSEAGDVQRNLQITRHGELLASLYPDPEMWQRKRPKMVETDDAVLILKDYRTIDDRRMEIKPCTLLFIQKSDKPRSDGHPGRVVVLDAPEGAILQFDHDVDLRRGEFGRLVGGRLAGEVTIRSNESQPGAQDEIYLATSNVNMDERRLWTPSEVSFRYGRSYGRGRDLIASFLPAVESAGQQRGPNIGGLKSLEIVHLERLHLVAGKSMFSDSDEANTNNDANIPQQPKLPQDSLSGAFAQDESPIEVTCKGPFLFDLEEGVASFEEQVDVLRLNKDVASDQLNCRWLEIHFSGLGVNSTGGKEAKSPSVSKLVALGYPVILNSPSLGAHAQGERLEYDLELRQIRLEGEQPVTLDHQGRRIEAMAVQYQMPAAGRIGKAWAQGPGQFRAALPQDDPRQPPRVVTARWQEELRLRPDGAPHVLSLIGDARFGDDNFGGLKSGQMHLWLKETPADQQTSSQEDSRLGGILPDRLLAENGVELNSPVLTGKTDRFEVWFHHVPPELVADAPPDARPQRDVPRFGGPADRPTSQFDVSGGVLRAQLAVAGKNVQLRDVSVEGNATIVETSTAQQGDLPVRISGDFVHVTGADSPQAKAVVAGKPAVVSGRGVTLKGKSIHLDRATNRVTIPGIGEAVLPISGMTGDKPPQRGSAIPVRFAANRTSADPPHQGEVSLAPETATITWQDGLHFDGETIQLRGMVEARTQQQRLRAPTVEIGLTQRIDLSQAPNRDAIAVHEVRLLGQVMMENRTVTDGQLTSIDQLLVHDLTINQQTGDMSADGPGWMKTVRRGGDLGPSGFAGPAFGQNNTAVGQPRDSSRSELSYLRVTFQTTMTGNIHQRHVELHEGVRAIYGPVGDWDETIDADRAFETHPSAVLLTSDTLQVAEMGGGNRTEPQAPKSLGPVELQALGNAMVEGKTFTARAHRIAYAQAKDLLVMEGDGRTDAELYRQATTGGQTGRASARKILYWPKTGRMDVDTFNTLDWAGSPTGPAGQNPLPPSVGDYFRRERENRPQRISTPPP